MKSLFSTVDEARQFMALPQELQEQWLAARNIHHLSLHEVIKEAERRVERDEV